MENECEKKNPSKARKNGCGKNLEYPSINRK
jgi:hypothetical protein